jgi:hypothetical protein
MSLDPTSQKSNFYFSLKKYIIDNLSTVDGILPIFDKFLPPDKSVSRWLFVQQGILDLATLSSYNFKIYCVHRQDYEGDRLTELVDIVKGYFSSDITRTDGFIRIPFYNAATGSLLSSMIITDCMESDSAEAPDQSKFLILSIIAKMASKI